MKIALVTDGIPPYVLGGMQTHSALLGKTLVKKGISVDLFHFIHKPNGLPTENEVNKMIFETFEAIKEIKVYQKEKLVSQLFEEKVDHFEKNFFFFSVFDKFPRIILELITIFSILSISILGANSLSS